MAPTLDRIVQQDFGGGMDVSVRPELVPKNGLVNALNGLYDDVGVVYRRGGSSMRSLSALGAGGPLTFLWDGWLTGGQRTLIANASTFASVSADGAVLGVGGAGLAAPVRAASMGGKLYIPGGVTYDGTSLGVATTVAPFYATVAQRLLTADAARVGFSAFNDPTTVDPTDEWNLPGGVQVIGLEGLRDAAAVFTTDGIWVISNLHLNLTDASGNLQQRLDRYSADVVLWGDAGIAAWQGSLVVPAVDAVWLLSLGVASEAPQPFVRLSDDITPLYQEYVRRGYKPGLATVYRAHYLLPILQGTTVVDMLVCKLDARDTRGRPSYPWSRQSNMGAKVTCLAVHKEPGVPKPALMGASALNGRLLNLSFLEPGSLAANDADGSTFPFDVLLRAYPTGALNNNTVTKLRASYQLVPAPGAFSEQLPAEWGLFDWGEGVWTSGLPVEPPSLKAYLLRGHPPVGAAEWGLFDWGSGTWSAAAAEQLLVGDAPPDVYGYVPFSWPVTARERFVQFRLRCEGNAAQVQLKSTEVFVRSNGRL